MIFGPIRDACTQTYDVKRQMEIGLMFGGGIAYEISPSFDLRVGYHGDVLKVPTLGNTQFGTNRWYTISIPTVGLAYHF
jgi:opacity protein-like surface antigen